MFKNYKKIKQTIKGKKYNLFIADTRSKKIKGLKRINSIPKNCGMLFPYQAEESDRSFTMKNVHIPLVIIFLDSKMNIVYQEKAYPGQRNSVVCEKPSMFVIEIPC